MNNIITRFAPSPTGYLHIGNIRTALYSWLYARKNNGKFFLRIEDTDITRNNSKYVSHIFYVLEWLGLYWDDDPLFQSKRIDLYVYIINDMIKKGLAYKCYCSYERLNKLRNFCLLNKIKPKYDNFCRNKNLNKKNSSYVVRFKSPLNGKTFFKDKVFKNVTTSNSELDDFIILRSNGIPTYNFCVVFDDYNMSITHVIRGEEHINNTPKQVNIIKSLNYFVPYYIHLPIILDEKKKKLSKRNLDSNIKKYLKSGFLPEAILNSLLRLGWSYKNNEIFYVHEIKSIFSFKNINKSPCILNYKKLIWINKYYISHLSYKKLEFYFKKFILFNKMNILNISNLTEIISFISSRSSLLKDIYSFCVIFDNNFFVLDKKIIFIFKKKIFYKILFYFKNKILNLFLWNINNINNIILDLLNKFFVLDKNIIYKTLRFFLTGRIITPSISIVLLFLGKEKTILRLNISIKKLFNFCFY